MKKGVLFVLGLLAPIALLGCGAKSSISGVVTYEGKAVSNGNVLIDNLETKLNPASAPIGSNGNYSVANLRPGKHRIRAAAPRAMPIFLSDDTKMPPLEFPDNSEGNNVEVELNPGPNVVNLDLKKPVKQTK